MSDYSVVPFGLAGFANPVEDVYPSLVPFIQLEERKNLRCVRGFVRDPPIGRRTITHGDLEKVGTDRLEGGRKIRYWNYE